MLTLSIVTPSVTRSNLLSFQSHNKFKKAKLSNKPKFGEMLVNQFNVVTRSEEGVPGQRKGYQDRGRGTRTDEGVPG